MSGSAKPVTYNNVIREMARRVAALERGTGRGGVDPEARSSAGSAADLAANATAVADNAAVIAANVEVIADNAADVAANAVAVASAAAAAAAAAQTTADGKNRVYRQDDPPAGGTYADGDLWFDTNDGNKPYTRVGTAWLSAQDALASSAAAAAVAAQTTADGKNKIFVQGTTPTATAVGDQWIDTSAGNTIKTWSGTVWSAQQLGSQAISGVSAGVVSGTLSSATLPTGNLSGSVSSGQISSVSAGVVSGTLSSATLPTGNLSGSVSSGQISSVDATVITGQVVAGQIASGAITTAKLAAGAVTATEIAANAVTAGAINAGAITTGKLAANAVTANEIAAGAVITAKLAAGAVTATEIGAGAITTTKLAAGAVTATEIAAGAITSTKVFAGAITANEIAADAITTAKIAANAITAAEINAGAITASKLDVDAMTAKNLKTKTDGTADRIVMGPGVFEAGYSAINFDVTGDGVTVSDPSISAPAGRLMLYGFRNSTGTKYARLILGDPAGAADNAHDILLQSNVAGANACNVVISAADDKVRISRNFQVDGSTTLNSSLLYAGYAAAGGASTVPNTRIDSPSGAVRVTTHVNSSQRFKREITDLTEESMDPTRLLALRITQFKYRPEVLAESDQRYDRLVPGLIAEEVHAAYPIAVDLNEDGLPQTWNAHYLLPPMLALIQEQHARIAALEAAVDALTEASASSRGD